MGPQVIQALQNSHGPFCWDWEITKEISAMVGSQTSDFRRLFEFWPQLTALMTTTNSFDPTLATEKCDKTKSNKSETQHARTPKCSQFRTRIFFKKKNSACTRLQDTIVQTTKRKIVDVA